MRVGASKGTSQHDVELSVEPDVDEASRHMVMTIRDAVTTVLGDDSLPDPGANLTPHTTIAYGIGEGDSGKITSVLNEVRRHSIDVPVIAVTQQTAHGCYAWEPIAELALCERVSTQPRLIQD